MYKRDCSSTAICQRAKAQDIASPFLKKALIVGSMTRFEIKELILNKSGKRYLTKESKINNEVLAYAKS